MTTYCLSSASRTRPSAFIFAIGGGDERLPQQPVPPNISVDTPDEEPIDLANDGDPRPPAIGPSKKRQPDEEHGIP